MYLRCNVLLSIELQLIGYWKSIPCGRRANPLRCADGRCSYLDLILKSIWWNKCSVSDDNNYVNYCDILSMLSIIKEGTDEIKSYLMRNKEHRNNNNNKTVHAILAPGNPTTLLYKWKMTTIHVSLIQRPQISVNV